CSSDLFFRQVPAQLVRDAFLAFAWLWTWLTALLWHCPTRQLTALPVLCEFFWSYFLTIDHVTTVCRTIHSTHQLVKDVIHIAVKWIHWILCHYAVPPQLIVNFKC